MAGGAPQRAIPIGGDSTGRPEAGVPVPDGSVGRPFDVILVGAGTSGLAQLIKLRELGVSVRVLEAGSGVGGTWYWNRYPGARLDSESYTYAYFFSPEILEEWTWSEEFVGQPELERYFNFVADKFDLRRDVEFDTRVISMVWNGDSDQWAVASEDGRVFHSRFVITATGLLSVPLFPSAPGLEAYQGEWHHTALWPDEPVDFKGKRVGLIGTGASGIQVVAAVKSEVGHMTVFQRTPNWATPINNSPISAERAEELRREYPRIHEILKNSPTGFIHLPIDADTTSVGDEEREAVYDRLWAEQGMSMYVGNYRDMFVSQQANDLASAYLARRIRERVNDPAVADKLIPDHGYGMKRPPLENQYYEAYNQPNIELISLKDEPIECFTESGLRTSKREYEFDMIVIATGFDAVTGALLRMGVVGEGGAKLEDAWSAGPRTYLGMLIDGFPNLFILGGPQSVNGNQPRTHEFQVDWITECLRHIRDSGIDRFEADPSSVEAWVEHVNATVADHLRSKHDSWYFGSNVPGKARAFMLYAGSMTDYKAICTDIARDGYRGIAFDSVMTSYVSAPDYVTMGRAGRTSIPGA
jgi:cation diffusion facilitator CzcD-associated flavoprotein CzcO